MIDTVINFIKMSLVFFLCFFNLRIGKLPKITQVSEKGSIPSETDMTSGFFNHTVLLVKTFIPALAYRGLHLSGGIPEKASRLCFLLRDHKRLLRKIKKFYSRDWVYLTLSSFYFIDSLQVTASLSGLEKHFAATGPPPIFWCSGS